MLSSVWSDRVEDGDCENTHSLTTAVLTPFAFYVVSKALMAISLCYCTHHRGCAYPSAFLWKLKRKYVYILNRNVKWWKTQKW